VNPSRPGALAGSPAQGDDLQTGLTLVALLYFWREVPETKGGSLSELEQDLAGRAVR
jgi:hypothetical protein